MSYLKKYQEYLVHFPIDVQSLIGITKDQEGIHEFNSSYFGPKKDTKKHGCYGILIQKKQNEDLHIREGEWKNDKFTGKGSHYIISKPIKKQRPVIIWRQGNWMANKMKGKGMIKQYDFSKQQWKVRYKGNFHLDEKDGYGVSFLDHIEYQGYFKGGCFDGPGRLIKSDDNYQDGLFLKGQFIGKGISRRKKEFVLLNENQQCQVYSTPDDPNNLPSLYQNLIERLCQKNVK